MNKALVIVAVCFALNLVSPWVVSQQRTLVPSEQVWLFDGPAPHSHTLALSPAPKGLAATVRVGVEEVDRFTIDPTTAFPMDVGREGLGPLLPYQPERRTYPMRWGGEDVALDYVGPGMVRGLETYQYRARRGECVRNVNAERRTGRIVDEVFTCEGRGQWVLAESSKADAVDQARRDVRVLTALQIMAVVTRFVGAAAFIWALVGYARK